MKRAFPMAGSSPSRLVLLLSLVFFLRAASADGRFPRRVGYQESFQDREWTEDVRGGETHESVGKRSLSWFGFGGDDSHEKSEGTDYYSEAGSGKATQSTSHSVAPSSVQDSQGEGIHTPANGTDFQSVSHDPALNGGEDSEAENDEKIDEPVNSSIDVSTHPKDIDSNSSSTLDNFSDTSSNSSRDQQGNEKSISEELKVKNSLEKTTTQLNKDPSATFDPDENWEGSEDSKFSKNDGDFEIPNSKSSKPSRTSSEIHDKDDTQATNDKTSEHTGKTPVKWIGFGDKSSPFPSSNTTLSTDLTSNTSSSISSFDANHLDSKSGEEKDLEEEDGGSEIKDYKTRPISRSDSTESKTITPKFRANGNEGEESSGISSKKI